MIAAILLAALSPLTCNLPSEFFAATNGTQAVLNVPVPPECVYDFASPSGKVLRVTPSVAAFYYSLISAFLEREFIFGLAKGDLHSVGLTKEQAFNALKRTDLGMQDLEQLCWLSKATNRVVRGLGRFSEGTLTHDIFTVWATNRMSRSAFYGNSQGFIVPRFFEGSDSARSIDFPEIDYLEPSAIKSVVTGDTLARSWVTWCRLDGIPLRGQLSPPTASLVNAMKKGCTLDDRAGSPATLFGIPETVLSDDIGESFTNVVAQVAPGCGANLTNATMRLDYRRIVALSRLISLDDRQIFPDAFGELGVEPGYDETYQNLIDATLTLACGIIVTNGTVSTPVYDQGKKRLGSSAVISADNVQVVSSSFTVATNDARLSSMFAAANCDEPKESLTDPSGAAYFEYVVPMSDLKAAATVEGTYRFAAHFNAAEYEDRVTFDMWHGSSPTPISPDLTSTPGLDLFHLTNIAVRMQYIKTQNQSWTLRPLLIGEKARIPTPLTHDTQAELPDGSISTYSRYYPQWLFASQSLVSSLSLFYVGNVVTLYDERTPQPSYTAATGPDGQPLSEAFYFHRSESNLSYDDFFRFLWGYVDDTRRYVIAKYTALTGAPPGGIGGPSEKTSVAETLSGAEWIIGDDILTFKVIPSAARYASDGNFYLTNSLSATPVDNVIIRIVVLPPAQTNIVAGRAVSVGSHLSYLAGFEAAFKNLATPSN